MTDDLAGQLGNLRRHARSSASRGPEGLAQPIVDAMAKIMDEGGHDYALFGGGLLGFEIGAGLAARRNAGVTMEVTAVRVEAASSSPSAPSSATRRSRSPATRTRHHHRAPQRLRAPRDGLRRGHGRGRAGRALALVDRAKMVQRGEQRGADVNIEDADVLVAGGRGLGKAEGFELAESLASALGGTAVAATRAVVDAGWYPYAAQIGQTGKTVAPKLYVAAGISGAIQHKVGMQYSENIVAINKDANAPIFEFSDLGIVGDLNKILPKLTDAVKAKKGS